MSRVCNALNSLYQHVAWVPGPHLHINNDWVWYFRWFVSISRNITEICFLPKEPGPCHTRRKKKWYYNSDKQQCLRFTYGGCRGNGNRFASLSQCRQVCALNHAVARHDNNVPRGKHLTPVWLVRVHGSASSSNKALCVGVCGEKTQVSGLVQGWCNSGA